MSGTGSRIAILPNHIKMGYTPGLIALDELIWPLGQPAALKGGRLRDLAATDHLIVFPRDTLHMRPTFGTKARVSIMILEPAAIHAQHMKMLRWSHRRFFRVLSCNEKLLVHVPNGVFFPFGGTWVSELKDTDLTKTRMCSLIASEKRSQQGHVLHHDTAAWIRAEGLDVDLMGSGYKPFEAKSEGLAPYRYSVVIENVRERNYFTEKLIDALLCGCVPIYWGCPNIADFFDTSGMIICESDTDIHAALTSMSEDDYAARQPAIEACSDPAEFYGAFYERAAQAVLASV